MKLNLKLIALAIFVLFNTTTLSAIPLFFGSTDETMKVVDLPKEFQANHKHYDLGYKYSQANIMWIPIWNWGGEYIAYFGEDSKSFIPLTEEKAAKLAKIAKKTLPEKVELPLWDSILSKVLWLLIIVGGFFWIKD